MPAIAEKSVLFPVFGLPSKATVSFMLDPLVVALLCVEVVRKASPNQPFHEKNNRSGGNDHPRSLISPDG